jgi:hypothetical protein
MRGKANCCCRARVQLSVLHPGDGRRLHQGVAQHIVRCEGGTRVPRRSHSCSCGERGSEDLPVRFGAAAARWCGVGGQVAVVVGAEVVVAGEPPGVCCPAGPLVWRLFIPAGVEPKFVCNGILSTGVCSLWLSRPEHLGI